MCPGGSLTPHPHAPSKWTFSQPILVEKSEPATWACAKLASVTRAPRKLAFISRANEKLAILSADLLKLAPSAVTHCICASTSIAPGGGRR